MMTIGSGAGLVHVFRCVDALIYDTLAVHPNDDWTIEQLSMRTGLDAKVIEESLNHFSECRLVKKDEKNNNYHLNPDSVLKAVLNLFHFVYMKENEAELQKIWNEMRIDEVEEKLRTYIEKTLPK